ncbi:MAG: hypothetical protein JWO19_4145 [Bryobacterales bacterium]|nr:hypothetical protein [Bryobacterales bacterium]
MFYRHAVLAGAVAAAIACGQDATGNLPSQLTLPAGTWISVRVDQTLSSDRNQPGDFFAVTLAQPLVANGFVVARRGQIMSGRVAEAVKAGRVKGTSRLGLELTDLALADGQQVPVRTQLVEYSAGTSNGRDATAIGTATGVGAAVGAAADGGFGAGVGAAAGAAASTIGVLLTRGRPTEVDPEALLTFRTTEPVTISTERSSLAFQPVRQEDYASDTQPHQPRLARRPGYGYPYPYPPYLYGPGYYGGVGVVIVSRGGRHW